VISSGGFEYLLISGHRRARPASNAAFRAALVAGVPYADVFCPGCRTSRSIDLRTIDRHPLASVGSLVLGLRCSWCRGNAPMPKIAGLYAMPQAPQTKSTI
jgi:hypothetical protein